MKFSINEAMSTIYQGQFVAGLPGCTVTEVLSIRISDGAGVPFASPGLL